MRRNTLGALVALGILSTSPALGQAFPPDARFVPGEQGSRNMKLLAHLPLGGEFSSSDLDIEQELSRPYIYASRMKGVHGTDIISIKDPTKPRVIYSWRIPNAELHGGNGGMDNKYFKLKGRYYDVQSLQFGQQGPDAEVGAHILDVTSLPDTTKIVDKGFIKEPTMPGGFHNMYAYKHSDGRVLLFTTVQGPYAHVYDMEKFLAGAPNQGLVGKVPVPEGADPTYMASAGRGYHDFYVGYDPATHRDIFYGAGTGGYYLYDVTQTGDPKIITSITGVAGVPRGHTFTPTPDGRYAVAETEYQYAPLRIFDLKPGLDGQVKTISRPIGAWTARWQGLSHNHEVRWPYVFVSAYEDGLQVFNMMDPTNPYTVGYYDTYDGPNKVGMCGDMVCNGSFGVDVRNADGLIVTEDFRTGIWILKMEGFDGWNGHQWGLPNNSSAQDWDNGPDGAQRPARVS